MNSLLQGRRQNIEVTAGFLAGRSVFSVSVGAVLPGQREERIYKKQNPAVEGRQLHVSLLITGSTDEPKCSQNAHGDHRFNYVLGALPHHFHMIVHFW